jgi:hypothetical protein
MYWKRESINLEVAGRGHRGQNKDGDGRWEVGGGRWEVGAGSWEVEGRRWKMEEEVEGGRWKEGKCHTFFTNLKLVDTTRSNSSTTGEDRPKQNKNAESDAKIRQAELLPG